MCTYNVIHSLI